MNVFSLQFANVGISMLEFAIAWLVQSTLLIGMGLLAGTVLFQGCPAARSMVYRVTLFGVIVCPLVSLGMSSVGATGWSIHLTSEESGPSMTISTPTPDDTLLVLEDERPIGLATHGDWKPAESHGGLYEMDAPSSDEPGISEGVSTIHSDPADRFSFTPSFLGLLIWPVTTTWLLLRLVNRWCRAVYVRKHTIEADHSIQVICRDISNQLGVTAPIVHRSPFVSGPCLMGIREPAIILPSDEVELSMREVLIHELAHLKRKDCHWSVLRQVASATLFFQPLMWLLSRQMEIASEETCDDFVVQFGGDRRVYATGLVEIAENLSVPMAAGCVGMVSIRSILRRRVVRILDTSRTLSTRVGRLVCSSIVAASCLATGVTALIGIGSQPVETFALENQTGATGAQQDNQADRKASPPSNSPSSPDESIATVRAWQVDNKYIAPDFEGYFPDDGDGGTKLDILLQSKDRMTRSADEILQTVRNGMRHTQTHRTSILSWIGNQFIWNQNPQNPDAVELMYHAADYREGALKYGTLHYAVYNGLSVVNEKSPSILRAFAEMSMQSEDHNTIGRIAWGSVTQKDELIDALTPFLNSEDPVQVEKAETLKKIFSGDLTAVQWASEKAKRLGEIEKANWVRVFEEDYDWQSTESFRAPSFDSFFPDDVEGGRRLDALFTSEDRDSASNEEILRTVRRGLRRTSQPRSYIIRWIGNRFVVAKAFQNPDAVEILYHAADVTQQAQQYQTRHFAIYFGLALLNEKSPSVLQTLVDASMRFQDPNDISAITTGIWNQTDDLLAVLKPHLMSGDEKTRRLAEGLQRVFTKQVSAFAWAQQRSADQASSVGYKEAFEDLYRVLGDTYPHFQRKGIDWDAVGHELLPQAAKVDSDEAFGLLCMKLVARLEDSHAYMMEGKAKLPRVRMPRFDPGFACLIDDRDRPVVYYVDQSSPAAQAGVRVGMTVVSAGDRPATDVISDTMQRTQKFAGFSSQRYLKYQAARWFTRQLERGASVNYTFETTDGKTISANLSATLDVRYLPRLPVPMEGISDAGNVSWKMLDSRIGFIYVRRMRSDLIASLDKAVGELKESKGLIIDVRGNSGGGFDYNRAHTNFALQGDGEPNRPRYQGPIALLIDSRCCSAGEGWASWFVATKRAKLIGETTVGMSGRKTTIATSNALFRVRYSVKGYRGYLNRLIERQGLEPDLVVRQSAIDLAAGRDTVLEAAREYLEQQ